MEPRNASASARTRQSHLSLVARNPILPGVAPVPASSEPPAANSDDLTWKSHLLEDKAKRSDIVQSGGNKEKGRYKLSRWYHGTITAATEIHSPGIRIALLADLAECVTAEARSAQAVLAYEIVTALPRYAQELGGFSLDIVARRGSWPGVPLLSIDPVELPSSNGRASQEAIYTEFVLSGMLQDYDVIHCLPALIAPVQILMHLGKAVLQNWTVSTQDPAAQILTRLGTRGRWHGCGFTRDWTGNAPIVPACIDLERFVLPPVPKAEYALYLGSSRSEIRTARAICRELELPLRTELASPVSDLQKARLFLDLDTSDRSLPPIWALRALACGAPVAGWKGSGLDDLIDAPELGALAKAGDWTALASGIREIPSSSEAVQLRREKALLKSSRRGMAARLLAEYRGLLGTS